MDVISRRLPPLLAVVAAVVVVGVASSSPASAHDELGSSVPAEDEHLDVAPSEIVLTFGGEPLEVGATVVVADAGGVDWAAGDPAVDGSDVTTPTRPGMADGYYQVRWRVVSADGAVISGTVPFAVGDVSGAEPVRLPEPASTASDGGSGGDFAGVAGVAATDVGPGGNGDGRSTVLVGLFGAASAVLLALLYQRLVRPRAARSPRPTTQEST